MRKALTIYLHLFRPWFAILPLLCLLVGMVVSQGTFPTFDVRLLLIFGGFFMIYAGVLPINDYFDIATDKICHPNRPLASGQIRPRTALLLAFIATGLGALLFFGPLLSSPNTLGKAAMIILVGEALSFVYSGHPRLKNLGFLGNLPMGIGLALVVLLGGILTGHINQATIITALLVGVYTPFGITTKDFMDIEGDRAAGISTLVLSLGPRLALVILISGTGFVYVVSAYLIILASHKPLSSLLLLPPVIAHLIVYLSLARGIYKRYVLAFNILAFIGFLFALMLGLTWR